MSNAALIIHEEGRPRMVDILTFAQLRGVDHRTVREWLRRDLLPGATKDGRGKWQIPVDAIKQEKPIHEKPDGTISVVETPAPARVEDLIIDADGAPAPAPRPRAFFTVPEAAQLLGISPYRIRENRDAFGVVPWGPNGLLLVPAPVVRHYLGL